jgi:hypothetical protein
MYWNCYTLTGKVSAHHRRFLHPIQPRSMYPTKYSSYKALGYRKPCAHQRKMAPGTSMSDVQLTRVSGVWVRPEAAGTPQGRGGCVIITSAAGNFSSVRPLSGWRGCRRGT